MSGDLALWAVIGVNVLVLAATSTFGLSTAGRALVEARAVAEPSWFRAYGCITALTLPATAGAWCWHAASVQDWRYLLLGLGPLAAGIVRGIGQAVWVRRARRTTTVEATA